MTPELAKLQPSQAMPWFDLKRRNISTARQLGMIGDDVAISLFEELEMEISEYLRALDLGLVKEGQ